MGGAARRACLLAASVAAVSAVAWPAVDPSPSDGLPVSNYAMFARPRDRVSTFPMVVLREPSGTLRRLAVREISGTDQPMQAAQTIAQAIRAGTADLLCDEIATALADVGEVDIVTTTFDAITWFQGEREPIETHVYATCMSDDAP